MIVHSAINRSPVRRKNLLCLLACAWVCAFLPGCRQRAYTELYVEKMAGEARMLEDRIYDYDAAYQEIELELEQAKLANAKLQQELNAASSNRSGNGTKKSSPPLNLTPGIKPNGTSKPKSETLNEPPTVMIPPEETIEVPPPVIRTPTAPPSTTKPSGEESLPPPSQPSSFNRRNSNLPSSDSLTEQVSLPATMVHTTKQPKLIMPPDSVKNLEKEGSTTETGVPLLLKGLPKLKDENPQGLKKNRIKLPEGSQVELASATEPIDASNANKIQDNKVLDISFHPTLCRGHNFDEQPGDDGLYLVVTPVNREGQVVNTLGTLTVVVEERGKEGEDARIGAWEFAPEQLRDMLEPIGAGQGFHIVLPFENTTPKGQMVVAFLCFTTEDGKQRINHREIRLRRPGAGQSTWTPLKSPSNSRQEDLNTTHMQVK